MKSIRHTATLYYYDGPQVFEALDDVGGHYIAVMVEPDGGHDQYLVAEVEHERLQQFCSGTLDLRSLLTERRDEEWFLAKANGGFDAPLALQLQTTVLAASSYLPEPGFLLHHSPTNAEAVLDHARLDCGCASGAGGESGSIGKLVNKLKEEHLVTTDFALNWGVDDFFLKVSAGNPDVAVSPNKEETWLVKDLEMNAKKTRREVILTGDSTPYLG